MIIGAQFYTLREQCKTLQGLDEALQRVAEIGYTAVQLSGVCEYEPQWMAERLRAAGLVAPITHYSFEKITEQTAQTAQHHKIIGAPYVGIGSAPGLFDASRDALECFTGCMQKLAPAADELNRNGLRLMYHNHNFEFIRLPDGKNCLEYLCEHFTPEQMGITLDTYWVQAAGGDPVEWLSKLRGRVECVHLKDMGMSGSKRATQMLPVGEGDMNMDAILAACEQVGTRYAFVEQDDCNGEDPFDCLRRSYEFLKVRGLR